MGAIVDILFLGPDEVRLIRSKYPQCLLASMAADERPTRRYRLIIPNEELADEGYYNFLVDNMIALSSASFRSRLDSDGGFRERMQARVAELKGAPVRRS